VDLVAVALEVAQQARYSVQVQEQRTLVVAVVAVDFSLMDNMVLVVLAVRE
jgi:hypothetical protein